MDDCVYAKIAAAGFLWAEGCAMCARNTPPPYPPFFAFLSRLGHAGMFWAAMGFLWHRLF